MISDVSRRRATTEAFSLQNSARPDALMPSVPWPPKVSGFAVSGNQDLVFYGKKNMVFQRVGGQRSTPQCRAPKIAKLVNIATITTGFWGIDL